MNRATLIAQLCQKTQTTPELNTNLFLTGITFSREDLSCLQLSKAVFDGCKFSRCNLGKCMIEGVSFKHCEFGDCSFNGADACKGIIIIGATFKNTSFHSMHGEWRFTNCGLESCAFKDTTGATIVLDGETSLTACDVADLDIEHDHDAVARAGTSDHFRPWPAEDEDEDEDDDESD